MRHLQFFSALLLFLSGSEFYCMGVAEETQHNPPEWILKTPEETGLNSKPLNQLHDYIQREDTRIHSLVILKKGELVFEAYSKGEDWADGKKRGVVTFDKDTLHDIRSCTKNIISALVGIAIDSGHIQNEHMPLLDSFPDLKVQDAADKKDITLHHALTMSAGLEWNEWVPYSDPRNSEILMIRSGNPITYVLSQPMVSEPGKTFNYNGGLTELLSGAISAATGKRIEEFAEENLFTPLGIQRYEWHQTNGTANAASGLRMTARDLAKFGWMILEQGRWQGEQLVSKEWVRKTLTPHMSMPTDPFDYHYGYQWRLPVYQTNGKEIRVSWAIGAGGQSLFLLHDYDMVVVMMAGYYRNLNKALTVPHHVLQKMVLPAAGVEEARIQHRKNERRALGE